MKAFIRKLSINERKGYMHSIIYSVFCGFHILISKFILNKTKIHYLTLLSISGSLLILMSFYRIFRSIKKYYAIKGREKLAQLNFIDGLYSFIAYASLLASLNWTSLTNVVFIVRLFPFISMFNRFISESQSIPSYHLYCFVLYIFIFFIIFIPLIGTDQSPGIFLSLLSVIFKFISNKFWSQAKGIKVDILVLNIGFYSAYIGGILMVITYNKMEHIGKLLWCLIILNAFCIYIMKIFLNKLIKNNTNNQKLLVLNLVILFFAYPIDIFLFKERFSLYYLVLVFLFVDIFLFYKKVIKSKENYIYNY